jgi:hypothetical protein
MDIDEIQQITVEQADGDMIVYRGKKSIRKLIQDLHKALTPEKEVYTKYQTKGFEYQPVKGNPMDIAQEMAKSAGMELPQTSGGGCNRR